MSACKPLANGLDDSDDQNHKSPEDERVDWSGDRIAEDLRLPNSNSQHALHALIGVVETVRPLTEPEERGEPFGINNNADECGNKDCRENNCFYHSEYAYWKRVRNKMELELEPIGPQIILFRLLLSFFGKDLRTDVL